MVSSRWHGQLRSGTQQAPAAAAAAAAAAAPTAAAFTQPTATNAAPSHATPDTAPTAQPSARFSSLPTPPPLLPLPAWVNILGGLAWNLPHAGCHAGLPLTGKRTGCRGHAGFHAEYLLSPLLFLLSPSPASCCY